MNTTRRFKDKHLP